MPLFLYVFFVLSSLRKVIFFVLLILDTFGIYSLTYSMTYSVNFSAYSMMYSMKFSLRISPAYAWDLVFCVGSDLSERVEGRQEPWTI